MRYLKIVPSMFATHQGQRELVSIVHIIDTGKRPRQRLWYSAPDATVEQLCDEVGDHFKAQYVDFQPPLVELPHSEYHAGDYID